MLIFRSSFCSPEPYRTFSLIGSLRERLTSAAHNEVLIDVNAQNSKVPIVLLNFRIIFFLLTAGKKAELKNFRKIVRQHGVEPHVGNNDLFILGV